MNWQKVINEWIPIGENSGVFEGVKRRLISFYRAISIIKGDLCAAKLSSK